MANWHYQLMRNKDEEGNEYYAMHEYYPIRFQGDVDAWTEVPVSIDGETIEDVRWMLKTMLNDLEKHGVIDYE
jgi:hypothetical protein